ncbi:MAG: hydrolase, partial [Acidimicrobiales bacterium]|nr:hydrolase [Acidimicrobiales bacterium]
MSYADGRQILDADSHLMELPGFLDEFIAADMRDRLRNREMKALVPMLDKAQAAAATRRSDAAARAEAETRLLTDKGWQAMGAFDPAERSEVLDLFGFDGQLVFATFATAMFTGRDVDLHYAGSAAHNRAVVDFCQGDPRLLPVGYVPLVDPDQAVKVLTEALEIGCSAIHVPSTAAGERAP